MDLRRLRYFVAVAEEGSVGRAAVRLRMAQPPLSVQIRKLESEVGTSLFRRDRREMELTAAGRALLSRAREALAQSIIGPVGTPREIRCELANCDGAKVANSAEPARSISYRAGWNSRMESHRTMPWNRAPERMKLGTTMSLWVRYNYAPVLRHFLTSNC